jgi:HlyD family secretion protein
MRIRNLLIVIVGLIAFAGIAMFASHGRHTDAIPVKLQKVSLTKFVVRLPENGVVMHERAATVPVLVSGNIGEIMVQAGSVVQAGQTLATIYNPTVEYSASGSRADYNAAVVNIDAARVQEQNAKVGYQAQVDTNRSALNEAKRVYDEDLELYANKAIPRNQVDADKTKLDQAQVAYQQAVEQERLGAISGFNGNSTQAAIAAAQKARIVDEQNEQQLAFTRVVAPFDGVIQSVTSQPNDALRPLQAGDAVTQGQALFTIAGGRGFIVKAQVDEQDVINVSVGQHASVSGQDFPGKTIPGHVASIAPVATKSTDPSSTAKQVLTTIALDRTPSFLRDGMSADVDILTTDIPNAIVVPNEAVSKEKGTSYVYVVTGGIAHKRAIVTGRVGDTETLVTSGLHPGETIVTGKPAGLADGSAVRAEPSTAPSPT